MNRIRFKKLTGLASILGHVGQAGAAAVTILTKSLALEYADQKKLLMPLSF